MSRLGTLTAGGAIVLGFALLCRAYLKQRDLHNQAKLALHARDRSIAHAKRETQAVTVPATPLPRDVLKTVLAENPVEIIVTTRPEEIQELFRLPPGGLQVLMPVAAARFVLRPGLHLNYDRICVRIAEWSVEGEDLIGEAGPVAVRHFWYDYDDPGRPGLVPTFLEVVGHRGAIEELLYRELLPVR